MAMFENFPYTDMHNLNLDWIIKIAKDFLDQYTHIQDLIDTGIQNITETGEQIESDLNAWYEEHSADIANQLATSLETLNAWYTQHSNDIANALATAIASFNTYSANKLDQFEIDANAKAEQAMESIPEDYSELSSYVNAIMYTINNPNVDIGNGVMLVPKRTATMYNTSGTLIDETSTRHFYIMRGLQNAHKLKFHFPAAGTQNHYLNQFDANNNLLSYTLFSHGTTSGDAVVTLLDNTATIKFSAETDAEPFVVTCLDSGINGQLDAFNILLEGGNTYFRTHLTATIIGTDGTEKTPSADITFYQIDDVSNTDHLSFYFSSYTSGSNVHWFNQYDSDNILLSHVPFAEYGQDGHGVAEVQLNPNCAWVKFSVWTSNGAFDVYNYHKRNYLNVSDLGGYTKLSALGDSIIAGYSEYETVENTYTKLIADALRCSYQNLGITSTPICPNSDYTDGQNAHAFVYRYGDIAADADLIVIAGGVNDYRHNVPLGSSSDTIASYESTFYGAMKYLLDNIIASHTTARIVVVTPLHCGNDSVANSQGKVLADYSNAMRDVCNLYGVECIDGFESGINMVNAFVAQNITDRLHPNTSGHLIIFKNLMHHFAML